MKKIYQTVARLFKTKYTAAFMMMLLLMAGKESVSQTCASLSWAGSGLASTTGQGCDGTSYIFNGSGDMVTSSVVSNPQSVSFQRRRSGNTTSWSMVIEISNNAAHTTFTTVTTITSISESCVSQSIDLSGYAGARVIRFRDTRSSGTHERTISDLDLTCASTFTLTYSGNTNTAGTVPAAVTAASTTLAAAGSLVKTGFSFAGWNANAAGTGTNYNAGTSYTISSNHTLYARWAYTVAYNANGGAGAPATSTAYNAQTTTVSSVVPTRAGFIFNGWNTLANGTGTAYNAAAVSVQNVIVFIQTDAGRFFQNFQSIIA
ncbi:MAG: hypothetical protein EOP51_23180, partial [Sphingobacteriales bacterium]